MKLGRKLTSKLAKTPRCSWTPIASSPSEICQKKNSPINMSFLAIRVHLDELAKLSPVLSSKIPSTTRVKTKNATVTGLEPTTFWVETRCSIQLSHTADNRKWIGKLTRRADERPRQYSGLGQRSTRDFCDRGPGTSRVWVGGHHDIKNHQTI